jgi:hypothetical protein
VNYSIADTIIDSISNDPEEWKAVDHYFVNNGKRLCLWIFEGPLFMFVTIDGAQYRFGIWEKFKVWRAYKNWIKWKIN